MTTSATGYYVRIDPDGDGFMATFRDIPEANTGAATHEETLDMAKDALITALDFYFEDSRTVPAASPAEDGEFFVELPSSVIVKMMLLNEMVAQKLRPVELAKRLKTSKQEVTRILQLEHTTKIDTLTDAFKALGKELHFSVA